jgi:hypothetical protein
MEVYKNTITFPVGSYGASVDGGLRSGTGMFWGNTMITGSGAGANTWLGISLYRAGFGANPWGPCGGLNSVDPWDVNDGTVYYSGTVTSISNGGLTMTDTSKSWTTNQFIPNGAPYSFYDLNGSNAVFSEISSNTSNSLTIATFVPSYESGWTGINAGDNYEIVRATACLDAPARTGPSTYLSGTSPTPNPSATNEVLTPIYQWNDTGNPNNPMGPNSGKLIANRDYYVQASGVQTTSTSPFDGTGTTGGVGWGTLAHRPACSSGCLVGVGYFATDQGAQGELFTLTAPGTWTLYYTPYTYPHPLDSSSGSVSLSPSSENFGSVNVGSSGSPVTFTLTNNSSTTAASISPSTTGGNSGDFTITNSGAGSCSAAGGSIAASASCTFTVTFTPGASGSRSTTLSVSYSGGDGASPQTSSLSGTGASTGNVPPPTNLHVDSIE